MVLFLFITSIVRVLSVDAGIIASLASRDEIWEIVIRAKVGRHLLCESVGTKPFDYAALCIRIRRAIVADCTFCMTSIAEGAPRTEMACRSRFQRGRRPM